MYLTGSLKSHSLDPSQVLSPERRKISRIRRGVANAYWDGRGADGAGSESLFQDGEIDYYKEERPCVTCFC